jgi:hypothetical protein
VQFHCAKCLFHWSTPDIGLHHKLAITINWSISKIGRLQSYVDKVATYEDVSIVSRSNGFRPNDMESNNHCLFQASLPAKTCTGRNLKRLVGQELERGRRQFIETVVDDVLRRQERFRKRHEVCRQNRLQQQQQQPRGHGGDLLKLALFVTAVAAK